MQELTLLKGKLYFEELYPQLYNMYEFIMYICVSNFDKSTEEQEHQKANEKHINIS